ncbi:MAG: DNA-directed RNA polymerase subunit RPC12/RpoP [Pseudoalteromonas tetraodonis]|jgi:DNA-directed RNA polymerase subunit RPC12/RpoP|uniref:hypothetical protein n=1 Tax=Pseudoalteromonas tetraodonis TaxID=43659 RepID=UPI00398A2A44
MELLKDIKAECLAFFNGAILRSKSVIHYKCPECNNTLKTMRPPEGEVYNDHTVCIHCWFEFIRITDGTEVRIQTSPKHKHAKQ